MGFGTVFCKRQKRCLLFCLQEARSVSKQTEQAVQARIKLLWGKTVLFLFLKALLLQPLGWWGSGHVLLQSAVYP